jgi:hypothetical protein
MERLAALEYGRAKFLRKLGLAEICLANSRQRLAVKVLEQLSEQIESRNLTDWESPELIGRVWGNLYRCYLRDPSRESEAADLYHKLCRLDPWQAIRWGEA